MISQIQKRLKNERLTIVLDITRKLKKCPLSNSVENPYIDMWNTNYPAIIELKKVFNNYINQDESCQKNLIGFSGKIKFPEINRVIIYKLPIYKHVESEFIIKV